MNVRRGILIWIFYVDWNIAQSLLLCLLTRFLVTVLTATSFKRFVFWGVYSWTYLSGKKCKNTGVSLFLCSWRMIMLCSSLWLGLKSNKICLITFIAFTPLLHQCEYIVRPHAIVVLRVSESLLPAVWKLASGDKVSRLVPAWFLHTLWHKYVMSLAIAFYFPFQDGNKERWQILYCLRV